MKNKVNYFFTACLIVLTISCKDKQVLVPEDISPPASIGQSLGGGIVFYVDGTGRHGLTAATADITSVGSTFPNTTPVGIPDNSGTSSSIFVSGVSGLASIASVCINVTHTYDGDLTFILQAPNGSTVELSSSNGGGGDNYSNTCFVSGATAVTSGSAPFSGQYGPEQPFSNVSGSAANGTWTLFITDNASSDIGTLTNWSITFGTQTIKWSNGSSILTGASGTANGSGATNTNTIVTAQGAGTYVAYLCDQLSFNGFSDWYLPSKDELALMYAQQTVIGGFSATNYWSSSEAASTTAWAKNFSSSTEGAVAKTALYHARAIRNF